MKKFWNSRYSNEEYAYGTEPNAFFKKTLTELSTKGNILLPAEGEGRNAVFAAKSGFDVTAFDMSEEGKKKAMKLAGDNQVHINYSVGEFSEFEFEENSFDVLALIYAHFPAKLKSKYHVQLSKYLKIGGVVIFEAFSKNHLNYSKMNPAAGGPRELDMLFSTEEIKNDFRGFHIIELREEVVELNAGVYHNGQGSVIRFIGRKTA